MTTRPVVVRLEGGIEYGLASIEAARRIYPAGEIVCYQDGTMIDPEDLEAAVTTPAGDVAVSNKLTRDQLEAIATGLNIEGADNKTAYHTKDDLVAEILRVQAEAADSGDPDAGSEEGDPETGEGESE